MKRRNDRRGRFIEEYLVDGNATQAAVRSGYSKKAARNAGYKLLRHPEVQRTIAGLREQAQGRKVATLVELCEFATSTVRDGEVAIGVRLKAAEVLARLQGYGAEGRGSEGKPMEVTFRLVQAGPATKGDV